MNIAGIFRQYVGVVLLAVLLQAMPAVAFCQEQEEGDEYSQPDQQNPSVNRSGTSVGSSSPWGNANSNPANTSNRSSSRPATSAGASHSPGQRPATTTDIDPGGSPDVPIDGNMTLVFLAMAVVFSFWVIKRIKVNNSPVTSTDTE